MTKTIHIQKADPVGKTKIPDTFIIINNDGFMGDVDVKKDAKKLVNALYQCLPVGTINEMMIIMLKKVQTRMISKRIEIIESPRPE